MISSRRRRVAIVALTAPGTATALRLVRAFDSASAYVPARFAPRSGADVRSVIPYTDKVATLVAELFRRQEAMVLIMATGAAVRMLAPYLNDKQVDPAVVVVDDAARFAISLVSGHRGGANDLASHVAKALGAAAVITTATDGLGLPAPELIGHDLGWKLESLGDLKTVAAALINGDLVGFVQEIGPRSWLPPDPISNLVEFDNVEALASAAPEAAILVSARALTLPSGLAGRAIIYRPPVLIIGIGCVRGASQAEIDELAGSALERAGLSPLAVAAVASIDVKANEPGLLAFCEHRGWPLLTFSANELDTASGQWQRSETVREAVGAAAVAEPAALLAAKGGPLLVPKVKSARVTAAIARIADREQAD